MKVCNGCFSGRCCCSGIGEWLACDVKKSRPWLGIRRPPPLDGSRIFAGCHQGAEVVVISVVSRCSGFFGGLFEAVVDVVALGGLELFVEVCDAVGYEYVVPLQQLLYVAVVHAVAVEVGQHFGEVFAQLVARCLAVVD